MGSVTGFEQVRAAFERWRDKLKAEEAALRGQVQTPVTPADLPGMVVLAEAHEDDIARFEGEGGLTC